MITLPKKALQPCIRIGLTVYLFVLFGLSDILILLFSKWPHLYGILGVPVQKWEEIVIYTPFARAFSLHSLFPIAPALDQSLSGFSVYPWITFFIEGLFFKIFAFGNIDAYIILIHTVFPVLNFWMIYLIFKQYSSRAWAVVLAFWGVAYFSGFHYADKLCVFLGFGEEGMSGFNYGLPEITGSPFPGLSLLLFVVPFYLTIRSNRLKLDRFVFLSLLWGLQIYVYLFNFIAGVIFFGLWIIYAHYTTNRGFYPKKVAVSLGVFLLICTVFSAPYYAISVSVLGKQLSGKLFLPVDGVFLTSDWGIFFSFGLPLFLLIVSFFLFRGDYYELFHRCAPVFAVIVVDLFVGNFHIFTGGRINPELYYYRISNIFFRFFYFIPFLYFITLSAKGVSTPGRVVSKIVHHELPELLRRYVHRYRRLYCVLGVGLVGLYILTNHIYVYRMHETSVAPQMQEVQLELDAVKNVDIKSGAVIVYEDIVPNLIVPATNGNATLLASTFGNFVDEQLILKRILLYAKLFGWSENRLLTFMEPNETFMTLASYKNKELVVTRDMLKSGLGYWLVNHKKQIGHEQLKQYRKRILHIYSEMNLDELIKQNSVEAILVKNPADCLLEGFVQERIGEYTLIYPTP